MSTIFYFVCHECKAAIDVGKNGYLWTGPDSHVEAVAAWLLEHTGHRLEYASEHRFDEPGMEWGWDALGDKGQEHG